jgi:hypothetical protein
VFGAVQSPSIQEKDRGIYKCSVSSDDEYNDSETVAESACLRFVAGDQDKKQEEQTRVN